MAKLESNPKPHLPAEDGQDILITVQSRAQQIIEGRPDITSVAMADTEGVTFIMYRVGNDPVLKGPSEVIDSVKNTGIKIKTR